MVMAKINGRYNLIAKDMEPKEFTEELSSLIRTMADDLDNDEDMLYIPNCTSRTLSESTASILS